VLLTNADGSHQVLLKHEAADFKTSRGIPSSPITDLHWSADGRYIAYVAGQDTYSIESSEPSASTETPRLVWAKADGSSEKALTYQNINILNWDAAKHLLIFTAGNGDVNYLMALNPVSGVIFPSQQRSRASSFRLPIVIGWADGNCSAAHSSGL
jgi:hypothetical protein